MQSSEKRVAPYGKRGLLRLSDRCLRVAMPAVLLLLCNATSHAETPATDMILIPGGTYTIGTDEEESMANERPTRRVTIDSFQIARTAVTNREFARFVEETGYVTTAEKPIDWEELKKQLPAGTAKPPENMLQPGSVVFIEPEGEVAIDDLNNWFQWVLGASWRHPEGPGSTIDQRLDHPVVHVSWDDAVAYAEWVEKRLPTEAEWEVAARGGLEGKRFSWGDEFTPDGKHMANTFTGTFPHINTAEDGFPGTAPVGSFPPNGYGLVDMAGNVWNWTADVYVDRPGTDPIEDEIRRVTKGGSYLCHVSYCASYRPSARRGTPRDTGMSHIGFRVASDAGPPPPAEPDELPKQ